MRPTLYTVDCGGPGRLDLAGEAQAATAAGLEFEHLPIEDRGVPTLSETMPVLRGLARQLHLDRHVVVHCRYGNGRASVLAAAVLVLTGENPDDAWLKIEQARQLVVPDTPEQRRWPSELIRARSSRDD